MIGKISRALLNIPGWHTSRKIVVIESDDWGSVRMPSRDVFDGLHASGIDLTSGDSLRYNRFDTLAGKDDYEALYGVLRRHRDRHGNPAVFTALSLVANPDFRRIKATGFREYYYEPVTATMDRYYPEANVFDYWRRGIEEKLFVPQFHGREHLNVAAWMRDLRDGNEAAHLAFEHGMWGFNNRHRYNVSYQAAFDVEDPSDLHEQSTILSDGLRLFKELAGYPASFFVPPNGILHERHYPELKKNGVDYLFSSRMHYVPAGKGKFKRRINYLGKMTNAGQRFIIRNAFFEPSQEGKDWVTSCLREVGEAFRNRRPAVISSHRVNFIGALDQENRERGLRSLDDLLGSIVKTWKDVQFMTSEQLGRMINGEDGSRN